MGGFRFEGPDYRFEYTCEPICRCFKPWVKIDKQFQDYLMNKSDQTIDINDVPQLIRDECHCLGKNTTSMTYNIYEKKKDPYGEYEKKYYEGFHNK